LPGPETDSRPSQTTKRRPFPNYGWPYCFYINLVPGIVMLGMLWYGLPKAPMQLGSLRRGDWRHRADGGQPCRIPDGARRRQRLRLVWLAVHRKMGAWLQRSRSAHFVVLEFLREEPPVNFRLLGRRNFGFGTLGNFLLGFALDASAYSAAQYLAVTQGSDAQQSDEVVAWTGLLVIPLVPLLMKRIYARLLVGTGLLVFAASCFMNIELDRNYAALQLFWPDVVRVLGQAVVMTPISGIAMVGITPEEAGAALGLFNMMRNVGGALRSRGSAAPRHYRRRSGHPRTGDDHGLCRLLRAARCGPCCRCLPVALLKRCPLKQRSA
jgi:DHA2 family multidrug resistance protein